MEPPDSLLENDPGVHLPDPLRSRYRPLGVIGRGAMGIVFKAHDQELRREVAIKVLDPGIVSTDALTRFVREGHHLASISSRHVVRIFDMGVAGGHRYLVMEHLAGRSVAQARQERPVTDAEAHWMLRQGLEGLSCIHQNGLVHRDVKPSNMMIVEDRRLVLIDFGMARRVVDETRVTKVGCLLGTPRYFAPELWLGGDSTTSSDLFALALTFFDAWIEEAIFPEATPSMSELASTFTSGTYHIQAAKALRDRGTLGQILLRALAPEPDRRFRSADAMLEALGPEGRAAPARQGRRTGRAAATREPEPTGTLAVAPAPAPARHARLARALAAAGVLLALAALARTGGPGRPVPPRPPQSIQASPRAASSSATARIPPQVALGILGRVKLLRDPTHAIPGLAGRLSDPRQRPEALRQVREVLTGPDLRLLGPGPLDIPWDSSASWAEAVYWKIVWLHGLERLTANADLGNSHLLSLLPHEMQPGAAAPATGRRFQVQLSRLPGLSGSTVLDALLFTRDPRSLPGRTRLDLRLAGVGRARTAWIGMRVSRVPPTTFVRATVNRRFDVALVSAGRDETLLSHRLPSSMLKDGENTFSVQAESFAALHGARIQAVHSLQVVLDP